MAHFAQGHVAGVAMTLMVMGVIYFVAMSLGALGFRVPPAGWHPAGWTPAALAEGGMITNRHVHLNVAWRTPQFWFIWGVLCLNVTAGIAVIAMASPMLQEVFGPKLLGLDAHTTLSDVQKAALVAAAAGLVGLISLFNSVGRIIWASASDYLGRKNTYFVFFVLGMILYALLPTWGHLGLAGLFVASVCIILTMYGGGFATVPAYLADIFGTQMVGAIHGRLITAWSVAGVVGPALIAKLREAQLAAGIPKNLVYDRTLYIMAGLLFVGFVCNLLVRPVNPKHYMSPEQLEKERSLQRETRTAPAADAAAAHASAGPLVAAAWVAVGIPFLIGLYIALQKAAALL
jgi:MFS family permease